MSHTFYTKIGPVLGKIWPGEMWCCMRLGDNYHRRTCPVALSRTCIGCGAQPQAACAPHCSHLPYAR